VQHDLAPRASTAAILMCGVVTGTTIVAAQPSVWAASATPCAWLPADAAITPRARSAAVRFAILLYAPRSLKEKTLCWSSRFKRTLFPSRRDNAGANSSADSIATS
jgi:hypothetical protein